MRISVGRALGDFDPKTIWLLSGVVILWEIIAVLSSVGRRRNFGGSIKIQLLSTVPDIAHWPAIRSTAFGNLRA